MGEFGGFRQRSGCLDFSAVSAIDMDTMIAENKVTDLQTLLDDITFSRVDELKSCSSETAVKLVRLLQFTIEYLLHMQENQNKVIKRVYDKNTQLKSNNQQLAQQNEALREDQKIYRRQLMVLKSTMGGISTQQPSKIVIDTLSAAQKKKKGGIHASEIQPILESVLQHEKESRDMMRVFLEEQRRTFMKELELNQAATGRSSSSSSSSARCRENETTATSAEGSHAAASLGGFAVQFDEILNEQRKQYENVKQLSADNLKESLRIEKLGIDLENKAETLSKYEQDLQNREDDLAHRVRSWEQRQKRDEQRVKARDYLNSVDSLASLRPPTQEKAIILRAQSRSLSAKGIRHRILHALMRQLGKSFRRWLDITIDRREKEQYAEAARLRTAAVASHQRHEQELLDLLNGEKERSVAEQAKSNSMALLAEQERARLHEAVQQAEETVLTQIQHILHLQGQLHTAPPGVAVDTSDTAVMTSIECNPNAPINPTVRMPPHPIVTTTATYTSASTSPMPTPHSSTNNLKSPFTYPTSAPSTPHAASHTQFVVDPALYAQIQVSQ